MTVNLDRKSFIVGFIKGYIESSIQRFKNRDGHYMLKKIKIVDMEKIQKLAETNAIRCLLYDREMGGENFTLGEILDALNKDDKQARQIEENLNKMPSYTTY